ncbi:MAG: TetR family transcriptional regulator [Brevundimonas sp.]|uniref:TetR/AcrR family transcriptional regulator n=1 Tax=Brevundimonas sp. TaxID=1871086 RepID=UPI00271D1503|nr:TetR family transcriptional regulator [Brevundimonas sp.]MDO9609845.1 TetR family transcriptional regulator [Brevundimonas sp.]
MQEVQDDISVEPGLRERKRIETHARIQAEGIRLFLQNGFEATTLDEVAAAADVSRRTLLNYFGSKEEIVFSIKADFPQRIADAVAARPAQEPLLDMVEGALADVAARFQTPEILALTRLIHDTPSLQAGDHAKYERMERLLAHALAARKGMAPDDVACRVVAGAAVSIMKLAAEAWLARPDGEPEQFGREAFAALRRVAAQP